MSSVLRTILKKKNVFLVLLFVVVGFALSAQGASAGPCSIWTADFDGCVNSILLLVLKGFAIVLGLVAQITNWAMQPSPITSSPFVQAGWSATRDFANSLFILILLGIALSFILYDSFGVKRALPKLLIIALLINFSVPIAGVALDFANIISAHFLASVSNTSGFTEAIAQSVGLSHVFDAEYIAGADQTIAQTKSAVEVGNDSFIDILFAMGIVIGMIFIFLALALMFLIRTGYLSVLLILLPIALVLSAFPPTSKHFSKWMSKFMQWTMFAPAATFFLYLSMLVLTTTGSNGVLSMGGGTTITPQSPVFNLLRYIMAWGLMLMSLTVAQSMGITGASTATAMWSKGTKWARGKAWSGTKRTVGAAGGTNVLEKGTQLAAKIPGFLGGGFATRQLAGAAEKLRTAKLETAELSKGEKDIIEHGSEKEVSALIQSYASGTPSQRAKAAKMIILAEQKDKLKIKDAKGNIDHDATRDLKRSLRSKAKSIGDFGAVKAIDASDFIIAKEAIEEKYAEYKKEGRSMDPDTGKSLEEAKKRKISTLYRKINLSKEDWDDSVVEDDPTFVADMIEYGAMSGEKLKAAQKSGNTAIIKQFKDYMRDQKMKPHRMEHLTSEDNIAFSNWLTGTAARSVVGNFEGDINELRIRKETSEGIRKARKSDAKTIRDLRKEASAEDKKILNEMLRKDAKRNSNKEDEEEDE